MKPTANETIDEARRVALDILKPRPADLEHGLALHREALVFESYGFAPRAAPDGGHPVQTPEPPARPLQQRNRVSATAGIHCGSGTGPYYGLTTVIEWFQSVQA